MEKNNHSKQVLTKDVSGGSCRERERVEKLQELQELLELQAWLAKQQLSANESATTSFIYSFFCCFASLFCVARLVKLNFSRWIKETDGKVAVQALLKQVTFTVRNSEDEL